jgi:flagellar biosynthetic protein FliP
MAGGEGFMNSLDVASKLSEATGSTGMAAPLQIAIFLGGMAFISAALVTLTAFTRIVIVLSFVRRALSTQEIPPTPVMLGLSLFLTLFVMGPTFEAIESKAVAPYMSKSITSDEALQRGWGELRTFMIRQTRKSDLALFLDLSRTGRVATPDDIPARVLIPSFVTSELKTAFIMGFCIYVPFLLIDLVVSVILMSLGMMMMPPVVVSTPLKLLLFVLVDGWPVLLKSLSSSFH